MAAVHAVLADSGVDRAQDRVRHAGHHPVHERHRGAQAPAPKVAALRMGAPATAAIRRMVDWADELKNAMRVRDFLVSEGEFDGHDGKRAAERREPRGRARRARRGLRVRCCDQRVLAGVRRRTRSAPPPFCARSWARASPSRCAEIGSLGFLERENASILNAALYDVARKSRLTASRPLSRQGPYQRRSVPGRRTTAR